MCVFRVDEFFCLLMLGLGRDLADTCHEQSKHPKLTLFSAH